MQTTLHKSPEICKYDQQSCELTLKKYIKGATLASIHLGHVAHYTYTYYGKRCICTSCAHRTSENSFLVTLATHLFQLPLMFPPHFPSLVSYEDITRRRWGKERRRVEGWRNATVVFYRKTCRCPFQMRKCYWKCFFSWFVSGIETKAENAIMNAGNWAMKRPEACGRTGKCFVFERDQFYSRWGQRAGFTWFKHSFNVTHTCLQV